MASFKRKKSFDRRNLNPVVITLCSLLFIYMLVLFFPLFWGIMTSFKQVLDFGSINKNVLGLPDWDMWQFDLYHKGNPLGNYFFSIEYFEFESSTAYITGIFKKVKIIDREKNGILSCLWNTVLYAGVGSLITATTPMLMGYMCAKFRYKMSNIIYAVCLVVMATPIVGAQPAMIDFLRTVGFYNRFYGEYIHQSGFMGMYFLIFYAYFYGLSNTYNEAAEIDGASQFRIMTTICFPLAMSMFATIYLLIFVAKWNDYNTPMMYLPTKATLAYGIFRTISKGGTLMNEVPRKIALLMMFATPIIVLFIVFKDRLMGNLTMGGIKE